MNNPKINGVNYDGPNECACVIDMKTRYDYFPGPKGASCFFKAPTQLYEDCNYYTGDGFGRQSNENEFFVGTGFSRDECLEYCKKVALIEKRDEVNGATFSSDGTGTCYCEVNMMMSLPSNDDWHSCKFRPSEIPYPDCENWEERRCFLRQWQYQTTKDQHNRLYCLMYCLVVLAGNYQGVYYIDDATRNCYCVIRANIVGNFLTNHWTCVLV